jgi:hypothetical protein
MDSSIIISWDESADKKVKSSDDKDLGKVQNVTKDYIQTKEGAVLKKSYFIPKYYVQGYDGDSIWISLRKDDVKERFERENPPKDISEFETPDYIQRRESIKKQYPEFDNSIPRYTPIPGASSAGGTTTAVATPSTTMVNVPWEKVKGKKAKSKDNQDLGKVEDIAPHYVEVKEGLIGKKSYFIAKHYIDYFDGDNLHTSLTKEEIKSKCERDSPPSESEIQTQEHLEQRNKIESEQPQSLHGVPFMATESGVTSRSDLTGEELNIEWAEVIHKHVRAADDVDMGDVERVGNEFIVVRQGVAKVHHYYIPKVCISNYDGSSLYLNVPSDFVRSRFERESEPTAEEIRALAEEAGKGKGRDAAKEEDKPMSDSSEGTSKYEEGVPGTEAGRKDDPLTSYRDKEPMTPAKIKEHEPTAVKRDPSDQKIVEPGQQGGTSTEEAREKARRSGMTKGTAGADETGSDYEQGAAGTNK